MKIAWGSWMSALRRKPRPPADHFAAVPAPARIGRALGGGFARGLAHIGVLAVLEQNNIPVHCIAGVSAGAIVAAAYASGTTPDEMAPPASSRCTCPCRAPPPCPPTCSM